MVNSLVISIAIGIIAGFIASKIMKGKGQGCWIDLFLGIVGGVVGSWLFSLLGLQLMSNNCLGPIVTSTLGAVIVLWIWSKIR